MLREAFDYDYATIATILETTEANIRQHVSRAKKHLASERPRARSTRHRSAHCSRPSSLAARSGDLPALERILAEDVVSVSDGAGIVARAARRPVVGRDRVARFVAGFADFFWTDTTLAGSPPTAPRRCSSVQRTGSTSAVLSIDASADGIEELRWVMVPDKLTRLRS